MPRNKNGVDRGRRDFLIRTGLAGAAVTLPAAHAQQNARPAMPMRMEVPSHPFVIGSEPHRTRKSFYDLTDAEVRILCRAMGHMRNGTNDTTRTPPIDAPLSIDSPLQWDQWAMTHARHCTETGPGVPQVHWSWYFLPWHRGYLFFLERQLANVVTNVLKEDGSRFALPYWDWILHPEIPNTRERELQGKPSPLFGYDLNLESMAEPDNLGFDNLALWDGYRGPTIQKPKMDPANERSQKSKEEIQQTLKFMSAPYIRDMLDLPFELFAGQAVDPDKEPTRNGQGLLEHDPHNNGHDWVGSRQGKNRDMGTLRYAALDPIFMMHHGNIDRVWSWYTKPQPDPDTSPWGVQRYTFTDLDGSPVTISVRDIVKGLTNVTYAEPASTAPKPPLMLTLLQSVQRRAPAEKSETVVETGGTVTSKPLTLNAASSPATRTLFTEAVSAAAHPLSVLEIETGPIAYSGKFAVEVFVNKPDANDKTSTNDPHYIGRLKALESEGRQDEAGKDVTHTFPVMLGRNDSNFYKLVRPGQSFTITLVPAGENAADPRFQIPVKKVTLRVFE